MIADAPPPANATQALPCPFCGRVPSHTVLAGHEVVACQSQDCPVRCFWTVPSVWNRRPASTRSSATDDARLYIVEAQRLMIREKLLEWESSKLGCAVGYLSQALDALRPPAEPPSATFWLGADA